RRLEGAAVGVDDLRHKALVVTARLALDLHVVGDDVGGAADPATVGAGHAAEIGGAGAAALATDTTEPAAPLHGGEGHRRHHRRRNPFLGVEAGMRRLAGDLHFPA